MCFALYNSARATMWMGTASLTYEMNNRPKDASLEGIQKALIWVDSCKKLGWPEDVLPEMEKLFWKYHDKDGKRKDPK